MQYFRTKTKSKKLKNQTQNSNNSICFVKDQWQKQQLSKNTTKQYQTQNMLFD